MIERNREEEGLRKRKSKKSDRTEYYCRKWKSSDKNNFPKERKRSERKRRNIHIIKKR